MMTRAQDYLYAAIMAGGSGTRFWPRSRKDRPKQILNITGDEILLKKAIQLIRPIIPISRIKVVTTESQADAVKKIAPELVAGNILAEPFGKNTAPAIGLSALFIEREHPGAVMVILPADHYIQDEKRFHEQVMVGVRQAFEADGIVTIGITPRGPETAYGYIETDQLVDKKRSIYTVKSFHEKPDEERARVFIDQGNFFWNSGIFIDYGVIERSKHVFMIPGDFGWDDVGSWPSAAQYWPMDSDQNAFIGEVINLDSSECIVYSPKKPVALLGVEDLVIVEEDDVLLVSKKQRAQEVKKLVDKLRSQDRDELL